MKAVAFLLSALLVSTFRVPALELNQIAGAAHAYPAMLDLNGKQLGQGEFTQEVNDGLLHIQISYDLQSGTLVEEKATFRQRPELSQKEWSWRETKGRTLLREYKIDFATGKASAHKREEEGMKEWTDQVEIDAGRTFAGFGFTLALQNLRDRLVKGEAIELRAVGFTPKPKVVTVKLSYHGADTVGMSGRVLRGEHFMIQPEIPAIAKVFVKISDTNIWLTPPPSGFLRWEGPLAEPSDALVRVDLASGGASKPAMPARQRE